MGMSNERLERLLNVRFPIDFASQLEIDEMVREILQYRKAPQPPSATVDADAEAIYKKMLELQPSGDFYRVIKPMIKQLLQRQHLAQPQVACTCNRDSTYKEWYTRATCPVHGKMPTQPAPTDAPAGGEVYLKAELLKLYRSAHLLMEDTEEDDKNQAQVWLNEALDRVENLNLFTWEELNGIS